MRAYVIMINTREQNLYITIQVACFDSVISNEYFRAEI